MNTARGTIAWLSSPLFAAGLQFWSSGDGTSGSDTYYKVANASLVPADQDFTGCLELLKTSGTQLLRYAGKTPISPEQYLKISARVTVI
tara:strand:- start:446 stop:712 length:267 start_codon:yes stop_codon:yes gene_type:complete